MLLSEGHTLYRVRLTEEQLTELRQLTRDPAVKPRTRDRLEMVRLSHAGWSASRIAEHLQQSPERVRFWLRRFLQAGFAGLPDQPHVGQQSALTPALREALRAELAKGDRTWSAPQIADWLAEHHGLRLSADWLGRLLKREKLSYKRTQRHLKHKQDPAKVAQKRAALEALEKGELPAGWTSAM
jgi:transposase